MPGTFVRKTITALALAVSATALPAFANAALVGINDPLYGAGQDGQNITLDTNTGLQWLDVTLTTNRSYNDIAGQFGSSGDFAGWRHAQGNELVTLFGNAGLPAAFGGVDLGSGFDDEILAFQTLTGLVYSSSTYVSLPVAVSDRVRQTNASMFDDGDPFGFGGTGWAGVSNTEFGLEAAIFIDEGPSRSSVTLMGHWLVREATTQIAAPGTVALFGISLAAIGFLRRRGPSAGTQ